MPVFDVTVMFTPLSTLNKQACELPAVGLSVSYIAKNIIDFLSVNGLGRINTRDFMELLPGYVPNSTKLYNLI